MDPAVATLQSFVDEYFTSERKLRVLEAGCGSSSYLTLPENMFLVGIDISEQQLERNARLDEAILGDIQAFDLPPHSFDMIICWDVLEHLPRPMEALDHFFQAINDEGLIILAMPNVHSLKGLVTKWTPHWFHVWVYRNLFGNKLAGTQDRGPFKTYLRFSISPDSIRKRAKSSGFSPAFFSIYEAATQKTLRAKVGLVNWRWRLFSWMINTLSFGKINATTTDYIVALKRSNVRQSEADARSRQSV